VGVLVDGAIGEVAEKIAHVVVVIPVGTKPDESFFVKIQLYGSHLSDCHVQPHVPLTTSDGMRAIYVFLQYTLRVIF